MFVKKIFYRTLDIASKALIIIVTLGFILSPFYVEWRKKNLKQNEQSDTGVISFWQYWTGSEREPLKNLVEKFNSENHGFQVNMLTVSMPRKKILMAIVGGVPPDLVHLDGDMVTDFALRNALTDLNTIVSRDKSQLVPTRRFIPIYIEMLDINNKQWALPLMPTCEAMHINKNLLRKFNLKTPETLEDIKKIFETATDFKELKQFGWLPSWPPWAGRFIPVVFGGKWGEQNENGEIIVTANSQANIKAWTWVQKNFAYKFPPEKKIAAVSEGYSAYQSPDNPFYAGKIVLENNGVWEQNLAAKFAPNIELEIIPFPSDTHPYSTLVTVDALAIPRGAKHPEQAFEFMNWLLKQENVEYLAMAQKKFSPLRKVSPDFIKNHPNKYIDIFIKLANSPNAVYFPQVPFVQKYRREIREAYNKVLRLESSAEEALNELQMKMTSN